MLHVNLKIKNFRCFSDSDPVEMTVESGITALVGPNNSGKSSLLRMFYELRNLFASVENRGPVSSWLKGERVSFGLQGVHDPHSILYDRNQRPMTLRINVPLPDDEQLVSAMEFTFDRQSTAMPTAKTYRGRSRVGVPAADYRHKKDLKYNHPGEALILDYSHFVAETRALRDALYVGPFRNILNQSKAAYYDLQVGTAFVAMWDQWKNGHNRAHNRAIKEVENAIAHLFGFSSLEINPSPSKEELRVFVDGQPFSLQEQGAGLTQFIVTFGMAATRRPSLILIDEPELNLHPSLQVDFLTTLATFASEGVLLSTHSIGLARSVADTIYSVQKQRHSSIVRRYEATPNLQEFAGELSFSTFREFGYDRLLLVEGPTDVRTIQQLLRKLNKDHKVVVFPLLGHAFASGDHDAALAEVCRIAPANKIAAIVDSERISCDGAPDTKRKAFADACKKQGLQHVLLTERRAIENYFSEDAIHVALGDKYHALAPHEAHGTSGKDWSKRLNWKIAHAMKLDDLINTDVLRFLEEL